MNDLYPVTKRFCLWTADKKIMKLKKINKNLQVPIAVIKGPSRAPETLFFCFQNNRYDNSSTSLLPSLYLKYIRTRLLCEWFFITYKKLIMTFVVNLLKYLYQLYVFFTIYTFTWYLHIILYYRCFTVKRYD